MATKEKLQQMVPPSVDYSVHANGQTIECEPDEKLEAVAGLRPPMASATTMFSYVPRRVDVNNMSRLQRTNLKRLTRGLEDSGATLANGKFVTKSIDAIRWLLENL